MPPRLDELLKAAGEPTRLRILNLLRQGSICVCDLQAVLGIPQPTVSRHLAALRHAGLVEDTREGPRVIYSLAHSRSPQIQALYRLLETSCVCEGTLRDDLRRLHEALRHGRCAMVPMTELQKESMG